MSIQPSFGGSVARPGVSTMSSARGTRPLPGRADARLRGADVVAPLTRWPIWPVPRPSHLVWRARRPSRVAREIHHGVGGGEREKSHDRVAVDWRDPLALNVWRGRAQLRRPRARGGGLSASTLAPVGGEARERRPQAPRSARFILREPGRASGGATLGNAGRCRGGVESSAAESAHAERQRVLRRQDRRGLRPRYGCVCGPAWA